MKTLYPEILKKFKPDVRKYLSSVYYIGGQSQAIEIDKSLANKKVMNNQFLIYVDKKGEIMGYGVETNVTNHYNNRYVITRKDLIKDASIVYQITKDETIREKRHHRHTSKPLNEKEIRTQNLTKRSTKLIERYEHLLSDKLEVVTNKYKNAITSKLTNLSDKVKEGRIYSASSILDRSELPILEEQIIELSSLFSKKKNSFSHYYDFGELYSLSKKIKSVLTK